MYKLCQAKLVSPVTPEIYGSYCTESEAKANLQQNYAIYEGLKVFLPQSNTKK